MTNGDNHLEWTSMAEFIESLSREVEIRESYTPIFKPPGGSHDKTSRPGQDLGLSSAAALFTAGNNINIVSKWAFCRKEHKSEECDNVKDPEEGEKILLKFAKCFMCFKPGHRAFQCRNNKSSCSICNGKHHSILCSSNASPTQDKEAPAKPSAPPLNPLQAGVNG